MSDILKFLEDNGHIVTTDAIDFTKVKCPNASAHSSEHSESYWVSSNNPNGGIFRCLDAHCQHIDTDSFLKAIGFTEEPAQQPSTAPRYRLKRYKDLVEEAAAEEKLCAARSDVANALIKTMVPMYQKYDHNMVQAAFIAVCVQFTGQIVKVTTRPEFLSKTIQKLARDMEDSARFGNALSKDPSTQIIYSIREESDGTYSLLNRSYLLIEKIDTLDKLSLELLNGEECFTGGKEYWLYDDSCEPSVSMENLEKYVAVLKQTFGETYADIGAVAVSVEQVLRKMEAKVVAENCL